MPEFAVTYANIVVIAAAALAGALLASSAGVRGAAGTIVRLSLLLWRWTASAAASILDALLPMSARNAAVSRPALALWVLANLLPVAVWCAPSELWQLNHRNEAALAAAVFGLFNLLFLTGAYWALKEGVHFMNGDMPLRQRCFRDLSTTTNIPLLVATFGVALCQVALLQHWLQTAHGVDLIVVRVGTDMGYIDHFIAALDSLPVLSLVLSIPIFADRAEFAPGWGTLWARSIATFGSFLLISIFLGFIQQRSALQHMLCRLLLQPEGTPIEVLLRQRLLRAPSIVKRNLRLAFQAEGDDKRRLRLLDLALAKHSFSAPAYFLRGYGRASPVVQAEGATMTAAFLTQHAHQLDREAAKEILAAALAAHAARALRGSAHLARAGAVVLPCLQRLADMDQTAGGKPREAIGLLRRRPIQDMLCAVFGTAGPTVALRSAATLLLDARIVDCLPVLLRRLQHAPDEMRIEILGETRALVADGEVSFARARDAALLSELVRTIDWGQHVWNPSREVSAALSALRGAVVDRQHGRDKRRIPSAPVESGSTPICPQS